MIFCTIACRTNRSISGHGDRASAAEMVDSGSIPCQFKPKTTKVGIHNIPAGRAAIWDTVWKNIIYFVTPLF